MQDLATIQNTARRLACTYNGETSCGTMVPLSFYPQFVSYLHCTLWFECIQQVELLPSLYLENFLC